MTPTREKSTAHKVRGLGSLKQRTEGGCWHIQFSVNGRQYRESAHTTEYNQAVKALKRRITEVTTGKFSGTQIDRTLMSELFQDVIADYELMDRASVDSMARHLIEKYLLPYFGKHRAVNVKLPGIKAYMVKQKETRSLSSVNKELGLLRRAFKLGVANGKVGVANVPDFKGLLGKEKNARQGFWEHSEYQTFRAALPPDERAMFIFGYWTGCRFGEIAQLEWSQVDLEGRAVRLRADQTKPGEARIIPLGGPGADLFDMLVAQQARRAALCPESKWVFFRTGAKNPARRSTRRGQPVHDIRKGWQKAVDATGIDRLFHDLRRTGVRNLVRAGVPEKVAMLISGHRTRSVFERYNIVDERDLHDAASKLNQHLNPKPKDEEKDPAK